MRTIKPTELIKNCREVLDFAHNGEILFIPRPFKKNVVIMSEKGFYKLKKESKSSKSLEPLDVFSMRAIKPVELERNQKNVFDLVSGGEILFIPRSEKKNIVIISEEEFNKREKKLRDAGYSDVLKVRAIKPMELRKNQKEMLDFAYNGEILIVSRTERKNVVIISEEEFNKREKIIGEYLAELDNPKKL